MVLVESEQTVVLTDAQRAAASAAKCNPPITNRKRPRPSIPMTMAKKTGLTIANSIAVVPQSSVYRFKAVGFMGVTEAIESLAASLTF